MRGTRSQTAQDRAADLIGTPAMRELVGRRPVESFRWAMHSYPDAVARWNFHPEYELHLIRNATGRYIIGNAIGTFAPGQLVLVGPNVPHDWISDVEPGSRIIDRDAVLQFRGEWIAACADLIPEMRSVDDFLIRGIRGIEFLGRTAERGARELVEMGGAQGLERVQRAFGLLAMLAEAPLEDRRYIMSEWTPPRSSKLAMELANSAFDYIFANLAGEVRLSEAARLAGMSPSAFSRYFKDASGQTFSDMVARLRLAEAGRLLASTDQPIAAIARDVGFANLSNFNRRFRQVHGRTPREFRASHR